MPLDAADKQSDSLFLFCAGDKFGYLDQTGKVVVSEGLVQVRERGKWGYLDARGQLAIPPRFVEADDFQEGLAPVLLDSDKWGSVDKTRKLVIAAQFRDAVGFHEGLAAVSLDAVPELHRTGRVLRGTSGFIDRSGAMVIEPRFDAVGDFHEGRAAVRIKERRGYIDRSGSWVFREQPTPWRRDAALRCFRSGPVILRPVAETGSAGAPALTDALGLVGRAVTALVTAPLTLLLRSLALGNGAASGPADRETTDQERDEQQTRAHGFLLCLPSLTGRVRRW